MKTPVLETERLILRPISLSDAPAVQKHFNNWNIIKNLATVVPWPYPDNGAEVYIKDVCMPEIEKGNFMVWAINFKKKPDALIGLVHFRFKAIQGGNRGFWLAEAFQGQGYMTEAVTAVQDFLFFTSNLDSITVSNAKNNSASRRVKEKTGAKFLRHIEVPHHSGETISEQWEVTRENWAKIRGRSV